MLEIAFPSFYISKLFWGDMPPYPPSKKGPNGPFIDHSRLFYHGKPLTSKINETPAVILDETAIPQFWIKNTVKP